MGFGVWASALWVMSLGWTPAIAAEPTAADIIVNEVREGVTALSADGFSQRRIAEQRLVALGPPAFEPLIASLNRVPSEAAQGILHVLEQIWLQAPEAQSDILERQLEMLRLSVGPYQPDISQMLLAHHRLRELRAVRALRRLNAVIETEMDQNEYELQILLGQTPREIPVRIAQIILPRSWKGTEADLWHIQRLAHLKSLTVFVVKNSGITQLARQNLKIGFPDLTVIERAEVFIGVIGYPFPPQRGVGCQVSEVQPGSPAQMSGIRAGDVIESVDGKPIESFQQLVDSLTTKHAYEAIELQVRSGIESRFPFEEGQRNAPFTVTVIAIPWEARRFPTPPPPPLSESLLPDLPFPSMPTLPATPIERPKPTLKPLPAARQP